MTVRISVVAEVAHDGANILYLTHLSGAKNQTRYENSKELFQAYATIQSMLVQQETGKSIQEHKEEGTVIAPEPVATPEDEPESKLSLVNPPE
jgi:hypothetical protein